MGTEIDRIIEEQVKKWETSKERRKGKEEAPLPVITVAREPGSIVTELVQQIAQELKLDIIDARIINEVAKSVRMSEKVVSYLDEKTRSILDNWILYLGTTRFLLADEYVRHLTKVVGTIGKQGSAIIIGRGANLILPQNETLRVRFIAPMEMKIRNIMTEFSLTEEDAKQRIFLKEAERRDSVRKNFKVDIEDPANYDLIINMEFMETEKCCRHYQIGAENSKSLPLRRKNDTK